jgi:hypothetical protein
MDNSQDTLLSSVYFFIERFVQRQQLCLEVIQEYRPHFLDPTKHRPTKEYASATQLGDWGPNREWKYFLHGGGCRLTHTITGEMIDWDAPDLYRFDQYSFVIWLDWSLKQNLFFRQPEEERAILTISAMINQQNERIFRKEIFEVLEQLSQQGKLLSFSDRTNRYKLIV